MCANQLQTSENKTSLFLRNKHKNVCSQSSASLDSHLQIGNTVFSPQPADSEDVEPLDIEPVDTDTEG